MAIRPRSRPWVMRMRWLDLLFAHWPLEPAALRPRIPVGLDLVRGTGGNPGCSTRFEFDLVKVADIFTPAP